MFYLAVLGKQYGLRWGSEERGGNRKDLNYDLLELQLFMMDHPKMNLPEPLQILFPFEV